MPDRARGIIRFVESFYYETNALHLLVLPLLRLLFKAEEEDVRILLFRLAV